MVLPWFCPQEIGGYAWHRVADLPCTKEEASQVYHDSTGVKHKFYKVRRG